MAWVKLDAGFHEHPKVLDIGPLAEALWFRGLTYAKRQRTDGLVPFGFIRRMSDLDGALDIAEELERAGLWEAHEHGYRVHDWPDWQTTKDQDEATSAARAEAGRRGGKQRASNLLGGGLASASTRSSKRQADTDTDTDTDTEENVPTTVGTTEKSAVATAATSPRKGARTPMTEDWEPIPRFWEWAEDEGYDLVWARSQLDAMRDHFVNKPGDRRPNWEATFRNWLRRAAPGGQFSAAAPAQSLNGRVSTRQATADRTQAMLLAKTIGGAG